MKKKELIIYKLSIIIPAYNMEKFISRCLDSIYDQEVNESCFEVITVNDGSTDKTESIIKTYQSKHPNLKLVSQDNQGLSAARNTGLKHATGNLIWFVDSDDATTKGSINRIINSFVEFPNSDFLIFDWIHYEIDIKKETYSRPLRAKDRKYYELPLKRNKADKILTRGVQWLIIYKTEYLQKNHLEYLEGILYEDNEFRMRAFYFAKEIRFVPFAHYIYTANRPGSITTEITSSLLYKDKDIESVMKAAYNWIKFENMYAKTTDDIIFVNMYISNMTSLLLRMASHFSNDQYNKYGNLVHTWKQEYITALKKSVSIQTFHPVYLIRILATLYFPKFYDCISLKYIKKSILKISDENSR